MSMWMLFLIVCVAMSASKQHRHFRRGALGDHRACRNCRGVFPAAARYCGQCGRPMH